MSVGAPRSIDAPDMRRAPREMLSLALIEARNNTLHLLSRIEQALAQADLAVPPFDGVTPPLWLVGHIGWFAEWWIARNTQRAYGVDCSLRSARLASIEHLADDWWDPVQRPPQDRTLGDLPDAVHTRAYLCETLEATLELLDNAAPTDAGLYFYRLALLHEDLRGEHLVVIAQMLGLPIGLQAAPVAAPRETLALPATRWTLGLPQHEGAGFAFAQECGEHAVDVPEFEIDAQPVSWQQYVEFVDDGGYERQELWSPEGWVWLAASGRRMPRYVEQIGAERRGGGGSVLQRRFGQLLRAAGHHAAVHLSWWEAQAWACWAGRRLATEVEWEIAAHTALHRGFSWGEVHEWCAGTLRPWPGFRDDPWSAGTEFDPSPAFGRSRVLRGASFATRPRLRSPKWRGFTLPSSSAGFFGFRTCAL